jgi:hypothetical protein
MEPPPFSLGLAALHDCYSMDPWKTPNSQLFMILSSFSLRKRERSMLKQTGSFTAKQWRAQDFYIGYSKYEVM